VQSNLKRPPLFADSSGTSLLALVSPDAPERPVVLFSNLYPFVFPPETVKQVMQRIQEVRSPDQLPDKNSRTS
jgi:hypothetical protein